MCWLEGGEPGRESLSSSDDEIFENILYSPGGLSLSGAVGLYPLVMEKDYTVLLTLILVEVEPSLLLQPDFFSSLKINSTC